MLFMIAFLSGRLLSAGCLFTLMGAGVVWEFSANPQLQPTQRAHRDHTLTATWGMVLCNRGFKSHGYQTKKSRQVSYKGPSWLDFADQVRGHHLHGWLVLSFPSAGSTNSFCKRERSRSHEEYFFSTRRSVIYVTSTLDLAVSQCLKYVPVHTGSSAADWVCCRWQLLAAAKMRACEDYSILRLTAFGLKFIEQQLMHAAYVSSSPFFLSSLFDKAHPWGNPLDPTMFRSMRRE